jgi:hypothetical protein
MKVQFRIHRSTVIGRQALWLLPLTPQAVNAVKFGDVKTLFITAATATLYAYTIASLKCYGSTRI